MSEEQRLAFVEAARADAGLQKKLEMAQDPEAIVEIAKEAGFEICKNDLLQVPQSERVTELDDRDLEKVAGGEFKNSTWCKALDFSLGNVSC